MESQKQINVVLTLLILISTGSILWWLTYNPSKDFHVRLETYDRTTIGKTMEENVAIGEHFILFSSDYEELSESWPRFRGADFNDKFFLLNDDGILYIIKSSTQKYIELDKAEVISNSRDAWAPMALANGYLLLRDDLTMVCIDLRKGY